MLTYETIIIVRLKGRIVGEIRQEFSCWRYYPKGSATGGEPFSTLEACKASLS